MTVRSNPATIRVRFQFDGLHHWPDAPKQVEWLRHVHHHVFHVTVTVGVGGDDRELEFFLVREEAIAVIDSWPPFDYGPEGAVRVERLPATGVKMLGARSCEMIARDLAEQLVLRLNRPVSCIVSEDGLNEAEVSARDAA